MNKIIKIALDDLEKSCQERGITIMHFLQKGVFSQKTAKNFCEKLLSMMG